jgi:thymidylate synthase (FAD)|tara:strand:- start:451 stop:1110 length:660 start_codon:yes stop_codon:yes gene_type:complete
LKVQLISHSQTPKVAVPLEALDLVAFCARVSNPENQANTTTNEKLVKYLMKHKHWSPLEMVSCCLEIETTRDIARQILRHRSFSFQEFSQRYADPTKDLDFEIREPRLQDPHNRQNSIPVDDGELYDQWANIQSGMIEQAKLAYNWAIDNGIAKEQARAVLPEGLTMSRMYVNGTLRSWVHYIELRAANGTQLEHVEIAKEVAKVIAEIFPLQLEVGSE